jgi:exonuclease SbcC
LVRLLSLKARNFKKLKLDSPIHFSDGITLISGLNESGKSSVLDAILYALFGRVTRPPKARNEDLVAYATKEATVSLEFEVEDRNYRVTRTLHRIKLTQALLEEISARNQREPLAKGQEKVNEEIVRLLGGITYHEIVSSTVVAQKELNKLIELNKDDRKRIINAFLNLESFNIVLSDLTEERREMEGTGSRSGKVQIEREKLEQLSRDLHQFQQNSQEKALALNETSALKEAVKDLEAKVQDKSRMYENLRAYEAAIKTKESLALQLSSNKKQRDDNRFRSEQLNKEIDGVRLELGREAATKKMDLLLSRLKDQLDLARTQFLELSTAERTVKTLEEEVGGLQTKFRLVDVPKLRRGAAEAEKPIRPFIFLSILIFAGAFIALMVGPYQIALVLFIAGMVPAATAALRIRTATSLVKGNLQLADLKYLDNKRHDLTKAQQAYSQSRQSYESTEQQLTTTCNSIRSQDAMFSVSSSAGIVKFAEEILEISAKSRQRREALQVKLQTLTDETRKLLTQKNLSELDNEINSLEQRASELVFPALSPGVAFAPELLVETLATHDDLTRKLAVSQSTIQRNLHRIEELDRYLSEHADLPARVQAQEEIVRKLERRMRVVKQAINAVQTIGESLRNRVRPGVQGYMGSILPALTSSKYRAAILDEDYNLRVWDPDAGEYKPKDVYSGGTEDQFLLAMRLAFALALLPEVKGQKPEFVFLDEPLGSSDEIRRSGILQYLAEDLSQKFKQIFIISHVGGLEEYVQNTITLDDGVVTGNELSLER